jgi:hypothetical protein
VRKKGLTPLPKELQEALTRKVAIHFIGFQIKEEEKEF